jgi:GxxExxY protein
MDRMNESEIDKLTHKIIGCAMKVHSTLGNGFQEVIYQRALAIELAYENISFQRELEMPIFYREEQIGTRRVDFFCRRKGNGRTKSN